MKKPKFGDSGGGIPLNPQIENTSADDGIQSAMRRYAGMSESQLVTEMLARAAEGRKNGTLTDADLDDFFAKASPALSPAQRERLKGLVDSLKQNK